MNLNSLRENYQSLPLVKKEVEAHPIKQFVHWMEAAINSRLPEPNAMVLATAGEAGQPHARVVLLKEVMSDGFVFYTNYESDKGLQIDHHPQVALVFNWLELARQVRIEGVTEKVARSQSLKYFQSRPKGSQIGAWVSPQSRIIDSRQELEARKQKLEQQYADTPVLPLPPNWGGYMVKPHTIEFWQGRPNRLHDRLRYQLQPDQQWLIERLAP